MNDCCEKCRFWESSMVFSNDGIGVRVPRYGTGTEEVIAGSCRRRSPQTFFPTTHQFQWCGEFEMREDVKPCMKCGKPSGADGMGVMENYVIVGRVCKACSEKVKEESCMFCQGRLDAFSYTLKEKGFEPGGKVCSKCAYEKNLRPRFT